jgi:hypothetical protein
MTRATFNDTLWLLGQLLQWGLLAVCIGRGLFRRLPCFLALIGFYALRAALLLLFLKRLDHTLYAETYQALSLAALLLQLAVAVEIALHLIHRPVRFLKPALVLLPVAAWLAAMLFWQSLPVHSRVPPDRLQIFASTLMILLCVLTFIATAAVRSLAILRTVMAGFAVYALMDLVSTAGRTLAATQRNPSAFAAWSYTDSIAWLLVLIFWLLRLRDVPHR